MIKSYLVGGAVRDRLMGIEPKDLDYAVEAPSFEAMLEWIRERGKVFLVENEYLTVRAHIKGKQPADFVLARKDGDYLDGRRPDTVTPGTILDDLARRDFTVNAIALDEDTGDYIDPHGGRRDIEQNLLRCVGLASDRIMEDALRMLRAMRFSITKGFKLEFVLDRMLCHGLFLQRLREKVSNDRKRDELTKCFSHSTVKTLEFFQNHPGLAESCFDSGIWLLPTQKLTKKGMEVYGINASTTDCS